MEVLTIGEKIKRTRKYKGLTLKDLSSSTLSISKLSGIENNKLEADKEILEYLSMKLQVPTIFLNENIEEQLINNYNELLENEISERDLKDIFYNLNYSKRNNYFEVSFKFTHLLIEYYLLLDELEKIQIEIGNYYNFLSKANTKENYITYVLDLGIYLYKCGEYKESLNHLEYVRGNINQINYLDMYYKSSYYSLIINFILKEEEKSKEILRELEGKISEGFYSKYIGEIFAFKAITNYSKNDNIYEEYKNKAIEKLKDSNRGFDGLINFAMIMMKRQGNKDGIKILVNTFNLIPKTDMKKFLEISIKIIDLLIENSAYNLIEKIIDEVLNVAISSNNDYYIEKSYFYKSLIASYKGENEKKDLYICLSFEFLKRVGSTKEVYERYMYLGNMYYNSGNNQESLNYFNLALKLKNKL